ncbi:hypothetical protein [Streptomyces coeruleorubidus]
MATPGLKVMELGPEEPVVLLPAGHALADRPFLTPWSTASHSDNS